MNLDEKKAKLQALNAEIKAQEKAEKEAKIVALGTEVQRAIKAKKMHWADVKIVLNQTVKSKKNRELLGLNSNAPTPP